MRVATVIRLAALSAMLSAPLAAASVAFASDDYNVVEAKQQSMASGYNADQNRDPVYGIAYPWTVLSDE